MKANRIAMIILLGMMCSKIFAQASLCNYANSGIDSCGSLSVLTECAGDTLCTLFDLAVKNPTNEDYEFYESITEPVKLGCNNCWSQERPSKHYWIQLKNTTQGCNICKVELFSCDSFLVCEPFITDDTVEEVTYDDLGGWTPQNVCPPFNWGAPSLTQRDTLGNILNCKHNSGDCNAYPMTLVPKPVGATNNDPYCQPADSCGLTPGRMLSFRLGVVQHHEYIRFTFRIYYTCPPDPNIKTCKQILVWKRRP